ncbi:hypothetical protein [Arcticibacter svalbardensis]|nr:hypothetical protein [Arcticibacter svalbardensis]
MLLTKHTIPPFHYGLNKTADYEHFMSRPDYYIIEGGALEFTMDSKPNKKWAVTLASKSPDFAMK